MQDFEKCAKCEDKLNCNYMIHRFKVEACDKNRQVMVNEVHKKELANRASINTWSDRKK